MIRDTGAAVASITPSAEELEEPVEVAEGLVKSQSNECVWGGELLDRLGRLIRTDGILRRLAVFGYETVEPGAPALG